LIYDSIIVFDNEAMKLNLLLIAFLPLLGFAQNQSKIDSLKITLFHTQDFNKKTQITHQIIDGYMKSQPDSTIKYIHLALVFAKKSKNQKLEARTYQLNANLLLDHNEYEESLQLSQKAKDLYEKINDVRGVGTAYNNIGYTYKKMGEAQNVVVLTKKGLEFVLKSIEILQAAHDTLNLIRAHNHLGIIYRDLNEFKKAKESYHTGLQIAKKYHVENPVVGVINANLGQSYIDVGKNYDAAIILLQKAILIYQKFDYQQGIEHAYRNLADAFCKKKDFKNAIDYAQKSVDIAQNLKDTYRLFNAYQSLYRAQKEAGFFKESLLSLEKAKTFEDDMIRAEKTKSIAEIETKYETEKKKIQITHLNEVTTIQQKQLIFAGISLLILLASLGTVFFQNQKIKESRSLIQQQSEDLKLMMKELHHRVKNNLAIVSSLLRIQSNKLEDEKAIQAVRQGQQRVEAMSLIHQRLYQTDKITSINIKEYINDLAESLMSAYGYHSDDFDLQLNIEREELDVDLAIPLGLIINELLTNSFKYAYVKTEHPALKITLKNNAGLSLEIQDNGVGIDIERWQKAKDSFGKKLIAGLTSQIGGKFTIENNKGTIFKLHIPQEKTKMIA
jgi:two-component sensor histidine kinase